MADSKGNLINLLALVQYHFQGDEHSIFVKPHGNSKRGEGYIRTMPSTLKLLDNVCTQQTPKQAVHTISSQLGGTVNAESAGLLPRNQQQAKDKRRHTAQSSDPLFSVMMMCKRTMQEFVRNVVGAPDYMIVLADERTLDNLVRFCAQSVDPQVLSVDPTFSLGHFDVTVTTYKHPMLTFRNPHKLGPIFIHQRKQFQNYHFFAASLVGLRPALWNLHAFGTDREVALAKAFHSQFPTAIHL